MMFWYFGVPTAILWAVSILISYHVGKRDARKDFVIIEPRRKNED